MLGKIYVIKKVDNSSNSVIIDGNGSETIDGSTTAAINTFNQSLWIQSNGTSWDIL
jgi:hypothetical protein